MKHIFIIPNEISAMVAYEYVAEKKIDLNCIVFILIRDLNLNFLTNFDVINCRRTIIEKIGDRYFNFFSYKKKIKRLIHSYKSKFYLYVTWNNFIAHEIIKSKLCLGHSYFEEGIMAKKKIIPIKYQNNFEPKARNYNFRNDGLQWIGVFKDSFPKVDYKKKYILNSFSNFKKIYKPKIMNFKTILILPSRARLPKFYWREAVEKLAKPAEEPFILKIHPSFGNNKKIKKAFESILLDLGFSRSLVVTNNIIIEAEMLFDKKIIIYDRSSLSIYAKYFNSELIKIPFIFGNYYE